MGKTILLGHVLAMASLFIDSYYKDFVDSGLRCRGLCRIVLLSSSVGGELESIPCEPV